MAVMRVLPIAACLFAALTHSSAALALTVINRDDHDHKVTIVEGARNTDHVLKPEAQVEGICPNGCVVRLNDSDEEEYELDGNEVVSIEDGNLYYDGPDAPPDPPAGDGKAGDNKGPEPKKQ
jgi:hypothetical protein